MSLAAGTYIGAYEVVSLVGAGGMGEVYRGKDTKLGRDVALKILPASFTDDPERVARFRREAQVLASLNHPHIAQIHGMEEANGTQFLVLELVDGQSLDKRIARGPIPVDEACGIAKQIAEALEAAHEKGIIHRDLKPANIALTKDGQVKVLDFGLAKSVESTSGSVDAMNSPTITSPTVITGVGVILGTAAYMSPEQAKGRAADKRSDIWAFGCVLYEMLTGKRAFEGEDISETLAAVLTRDPDWSLNRLDAPGLVRALLQRCLEKDAQRRIRDISAALFVLNERTSSASTPSTLVSPSGAEPISIRWSRRTVFIAAAGLGAVLAVSLGEFGRSREPVGLISRLSVPTSATTALTVNGVDRDLTVTPDGSRVLYVGGNGTQLFVRSLDQFEPRALTSGNSLRGVFSSPDGHWVGYVII